MNTQQLMRLVSVTTEVEALKKECEEALNKAISDENGLDADIAIAATDVAQLKAVLAVLKT
jgi:hypothetical protein